MNSWAIHGGLWWIVFSARMWAGNLPELAASFGLTFYLREDRPPESVQLVISIPDQQLALIETNRLIAAFPVSTSKYGVGDALGSYKTPQGMLRVAAKVGDRLPAGSVIKGRTPTGEIVPPNAPGRDAIVSRVLWLEGLETCNSNARQRGIYIHGTPEESRLGQPASWGCIRMRSRDVITIFDRASPGSRVHILPVALKQAVSAFVRSPSLPDDRWTFSLRHTLPPPSWEFGDLRAATASRFTRGQE